MADTRSINDIAYDTAWKKVKNQRQRVYQNAIAETGGASYFVESGNKAIMDADQADTARKMRNLVPEGEPLNKRKARRKGY